MRKLNNRALYYTARMRIGYYRYEQEALFSSTQTHRLTQLYLRATLGSCWPSQNHAGFSRDPKTERHKRRERALEL